MSAKDMGYGVKKRVNFFIFVNKWGKTIFFWGELMKC